MNQVKAGVVLNFAIIGLNAITGLLYTPYMMECLGQNEYGLYSLVASLIAYITILDCGFGNAVVRYTARLRVSGTKEEQWNLFGMVLIINCLLSLIGLIVGSALYFNVDVLFDRTMSVEDLDQARIMLIFLIANLALTFPLGIFTSIITAYEDFVFQKTLNLLRIIMCTLTIVVLLYYGYKAIAMVVVQTIFNILTLLINYFYCRHKLKIHIRFGKFKWPLFKEISVYSFWVFMNAIIDRVYWSTGQFVLGVVSGTVAIAIFSAAVTLNQMYNSFSGAVSGVLLPKISKLVVADETNKNKISDLFISTGRLQAIILFMVLSGYIIFGRGFVALWAGEGYEQTFYVALVLFVALFTPLIQNTGLIILQARNQMEFRIIVYFVIALLSLVAQYYWGKLYGPIGCAVAIGAAIFIGPGLVINYYYRKYQYIDTAKFWREIFKMSRIPVLVTIVGLFTCQWVDYSVAKNFGIGILVFCIVYMPLFWRWSLNDYERSMIVSMLMKIKRKVIHD